MRAGGRTIALAGDRSPGALFRLSPDELRTQLDQASARADVEGIEVARLLAPIDAQEVWAAGVTYRRSEEARVEESSTPDVYSRVYAAERPELFFKATPHRVSGPDEPIAVRADSVWDVPEPELALVLNRRLEIVGYTIGNDVSSRSIEGENPLYLPQAKVYLGGCALGPAITPAWLVAEPYDLAIRMRVERAGAEVWSGAASTAGLKRRFEELVAYLGRDNSFPDGAVLLTGTGLVPDAPFTLLPGDVVEITIDDVGTLRNPVIRRSSG
ncbi:MAG: fumarylacetoacetate hydrolase family protein [Chloroflexi bacterium]|nr:fumarylacetoacetate hydrolase family protein [Chloroflexota bacterium]